MNIGVEVLKESVIRVQSQLNDWMDCVFIVSKDDEEKARRSSVSSTDRDISSKTKMRFTTDRMIRVISRNYPTRCTRETASCRSATSRTIWQRKFSRHWTGST